MRTDAMKRLRTLLLLGCLLAPTPACADAFAEAMAAYNKGDYATAFQLMQEAAEAGLPPAQYEFGYMYAEGQGVAQDLALAMAWYRKAADQGDATKALSP